MWYPTLHHASSSSGDQRRASDPVVNNATSFPSSSGDFCAISTDSMVYVQNTPAIVSGKVMSPFAVIEPVLLLELVRLFCLASIAARTLV
jgi:hypothetical protein